MQLPPPQHPLELPPQSSSFWQSSPPLHPKSQWCSSHNTSLPLVAHFTCT